MLDDLWVNRNDECNEIFENINASENKFMIQIICGLAGTGKTQLSIYIGMNQIFNLKLFFNCFDDETLLNSIISYTNHMEGTIDLEQRCNYLKKQLQLTKNVIIFEIYYHIFNQLIH